MKITGKFETTASSVNFTQRLLSAILARRLEAVASRIEISANHTVVSAKLPGLDRHLISATAAEALISLPALQEIFWEEIELTPRTDGTTEYTIQFPRAIEALARIGLGLPSFMQLMQSQDGKTSAWAGLMVCLAVQVAISVGLRLSLAHARRTLQRSLQS